MHKTLVGKNFGKLGKFLVIHPSFTPPNNAYTESANSISYLAFLHFFAVDVRLKVEICTWNF